MRALFLTPLPLLLLADLAAAAPVIRAPERHLSADVPSPPSPSR